MGSSLALLAAGALELAHTADHRNCPACAALNGQLSGVREGLARLTLSAAAPLWLELRRQSLRLKPRTHETDADYFNALTRFFGQVRLSDITAGHLRAYQIARLNNSILVQNQEKHPWQRTAGHSRVNHELSALAQLLSHCRLWAALKPFYFPLPVSPWSPRTALTEREEQRLFEAGSRTPEARLAWLVAAITSNTGAAGLELRGLRLKHLFLPAGQIAEIYIPEDSVKNNARPRKIALNPTARRAVEECLKRALKLGSCEPDHYLFPFRVSRTRWDPTRPPSRSWLRKSWAHLLQDAGLAEVRPHDLRHLFATRLLESDVNIETARAILGHVSQRMTEYYAHQRKGVRYAAVMAIERKKSA